ncbi:MAG: D-alanyl-D-alanine carboxypeptidase, partial [Oscillospiraceae bacterium]|nr:D-alanyl-D-alanine carboxypeptidase [Oscillospiraceae bacterium]
MKKTLCFLLAAAICLPAGALAAQPEVSAHAYIVTDAENGRVLYSRNAEEKMLIASVTKLVTALVVVERCELAEKVTVPREAANVEGSSMYLKEGEELTVLELLYGMLLESGNDAAAALAYHVAGSIEGFAALMNEKASQLGADNSSFKNPHGLDAPDHCSCARDMAIIAAEFMKNKTLSDICSTLSASVAGRNLTNHNKLLTLYPGAIGLKTGYTKSAGRTLVSCAEKNGLRL